MKLDELSQYWARKLWSIRPLPDDLLPLTNSRGDPEPEWTMGLYDPTGELTCIGRSESELRDLLFSHYSPKYTTDFTACLDVIKYLQVRDAWVKIVSPFVSNEHHCPINPAYRAQWEETRHFWYASVDFQGTSDTNPPWKAGSDNPAWAICDAGRQWLDHLVCR